MASWPIGAATKADVFNHIPVGLPGASNHEIHAKAELLSIITVRRACQELYQTGHICRAGPFGRKKFWRYYREDEDMTAERIWYPLEIERLTQWWYDGLATQEMCRRLRRGKSSVLNKVHRLGLTPRPSPIMESKPAPATARTGLGPQPLPPFHPLTWGALEAQAERWR